MPASRPVLPIRTRIAAAQLAFWFAWCIAGLASWSSLGPACPLGGCSAALVASQLLDAAVPVVLWLGGGIAISLAVGAHRKDGDRMELLLRLIRVAALFAYAVALYLPLFETAEMGDAAGAWAFFLGWAGLLEGRLAWLANPLFLLALFAFREQPRTAILLSGIALALAVFDYPYAYVTSLGFDSSREMEAGRVTGLGAAAPVWLASLALGVMYCVLLVRQGREGRLNRSSATTPPTTPPPPP